MQFLQLAALAALVGVSTAAETGWSGAISTKDGGLGGTVSVINDTAIMISSYTLKDASAPALYWWGAKDSNLPKGFRINNERVSMPASTNSIVIPLNAGYKAADFTYVGLWCEKLNANFGQAMLAKDGAAAAPSPTGGSTDKKGAASGLAAGSGAVAAVALNAVAFAMYMI